MGDEEKKARLLLNTLERLVIRYNPLLEMASEYGEDSYEDLHDLLLDNIRLLVFQQQIGALEALKEEGKIKPAGTRCWGIIDGELD